MVTMHGRTNREAYHAFESLVTDGKEVDLSKFKDDEDLQEQGVQEMKKVYLKKVKEVLKASPTDKFEEALLLGAYELPTEAEIREMVTTYKDKLTFDLFNELGKKMKTMIIRRLDQAATGHLTEKHIDDLLDYALHPEAIEHLKGYVTLDQAKSLLQYFTRNKDKVGKLGIYDVMQHHGEYARERREPFLPAPLVSKLEKALEEKKKKEEEARLAA
jgi:hypothetical protein